MGQLALNAGNRFGRPPRTTVLLAARRVPVPTLRIDYRRPAGFGQNQTFDRSL